MKRTGLKITAVFGVILIAAWLWPGRAKAQFTVHDPIHTMMNAGNWISQLERMAQQIEHLRRRVQQWDDDFTQLWGRQAGRVHTVLRTSEQLVYAGRRPWHDVLQTGEAIYNQLNQVTRTPEAGFGSIKAVRDGFTVIRPSLDRYPAVAPAVKDYYRALGNLSSEGLYVSARTYEAGQKLWSDAEKLNEYARDASPAGVAKTQAFAESVGVHAQGYQLETLNRILRQLSYLNMKQENDQRVALQAAASMQEALTHLYRDLPVKTHLID